MTIAVMKTKAELALAEQFGAAIGSLPGGPETMATRADAMAAFVMLGLPHRRMEDWKYTDLRAALKDPHAPAIADTAIVTAADLSAALGPFADVDATRIVFVNGHYRAALSTADGPDGVTIRPLSQNFGSLAPEESDAVAALNTAFVTDGTAIAIAPGVTLAKPILIVALAAGAVAQLATLRHQLTVGAGATATVVELFLTAKSAPADGQVNTLTTVSVGDASALSHLKVALDSGLATHLANWAVTLGRDSVYRGFHATAGTALARNGLAVTFAGEGGKLDLSGIFLGRGTHHIDTTLTVDHAVPHCESRELFSGVLDDRARGVFQGKIIVRPHAQKTDGKQMARVLMLSPDAEFDSKPELEIYADDVVCGHGSTAAEIDQDLMFYCQARGIPPLQARALLVEAFIGEAIDKVEHVGLREAFAHVARDWLAGGA